ncbi:MAG: phosphatase PAP2 family protein [Janthinobacterium lividum]
MNVIENTRQSVQRANDMQPAPQIAVRHIALGIICSIVFTVAFAQLFDFVQDHGKTITPFDRNILYWMYHHRAHWLTQTAKALARMGSPPVIAGVALVSAVVGMFWHKVRGAAWTMPIAIIGSGIIIQCVKLFIKRPRPSFFAPLLHESGFSFPSGHSLIAMVVYGLLGYFVFHLFRNSWVKMAVRIITVLVVVAIGVSRVYVGVHYPTDVLAGWTAGIPWLMACIWLHEVLARRWPSSGEPVLTPQA